MAFQIRQVLALPATPEPSTLYFVSSTTAGTQAEAYITDVNGDVRDFGNTTFINNLVQAAVSSALEIKGAADIAARDLLPTGMNFMVLVADASADPTVNSGAATYFWDDTAATFTKISEMESLDLVFTWAGITDGPASTPAQVDQAVADSHTHANKAELDKIDEDVDGNPRYDGDAFVLWSETAW